LIIIDEAQDLGKEYLEKTANLFLEIDGEKEKDCIDFL
jgi:hypothetical protein